MSDHINAYISTVAVVTLVAILGWRRAGTPISFGFIFPIWYAIYSFIGPLPFVLGESFDSFTEAYRVWDKMYPLRDGPHVWGAHVIYTSFFVAWAGAFFAFASQRGASSRRPVTSNRDGPEFTRRLSVGVSLVLGGTVIGSLWTKYGALMLAGVSIYAAKGTRQPELMLSTVDKGLFSLWGASLVASTVITIMVHNRGRRSWPLATIWIAFLGTGIAMGDRSQTFTFVLAGAFAVVVNRPSSRRRSVLTLTALLLSLLVVNAIIKQHRSTGGKLEQETTIATTATDPHYLTSSVLGSVESFSAYAALPILLDCGVQPNGGQALLRLSESFIPRIFAEGRLAGSGSYREYAEIAGFAESKQGFCLHFVADCYLNFGFIGVAIMGAVLGTGMAMLEDAGRRSGAPFWMAAWLTALGAIPAHLRGGIEGLRAVAYEYWLMPFLLLVAMPALARWARSGSSLSSEMPLR